MFAFTEHKWHFHLFDNTRRDVSCIVNMTNHIKQNNKLVATQTGNSVVITNTLTNTATGFKQEFITGRVTQSIVNVFEAIEVNKQHRKIMVRITALMFECLLQPFGEHRTV